MKGTFVKGTFVMAAAALAALWSSQASATLLVIGDCLGSACTPTLIDSSTTGSASVAGSPLGNWSVTASAVGSPILPSATLDSNTIAVQAASGGTALIAIGLTSLPTPKGSNTYLSSFSVNPGTQSPPGFTIVESTYDDPLNSQFNATPANRLDTQIFTTIMGAGPFTAISLNDVNPFSLIELYKITAPAACSRTRPCSFNLTINMSSVATPEPASLALLGTGLFGLGAIRRRRRV